MIYIEVTERRAGEAYADFCLYLPAGKSRFLQYRFVYVERPEKADLCYDVGPNDPANSRLYRIREAFIGRLSEGHFAPDYRILQYGEIGFAMQEEGAGDYVGGVHGDEVADTILLMGDGTAIPLDAPFFGAYTEITLLQKSVIFRCNTPSTPLCLHEQCYTLRGGEMTLAHRVEFLRDANRLVAACMPMLTIERLDPADPSHRLTDLISFYDREGGSLVATLDTTPYGTTPPEGLSSSCLRGTPATAVVAIGRESGVMAEAGLRLPSGSPLLGRVRSSVWIRYGNDYDSKVYFDVGGKTAPRCGEVWETEAYYRITVDEKILT